MVEQSPRKYPEPTPGRRRLHEIDLLRFVAALAVVLLHYSFAHASNESEVDFAPELGAVTRYGYLGVDLFFMISGLVVFMSLWGRRPSAFLISRISRLYPAYWVAVTLTALTVVVLGARGRNDVTLPQYLVNLTMFPATINVEYVEGVYWTLWSEWRFYALLFVFALFGLTVRRTRLLLWGWLTATVLLELLPVPAEAVVALVVQPLYSHYFIAGMVLHLVHRSGWTRELAVLFGLCHLNASYQAVQLAQLRNRTEATGLDPVVVVLVVTAIFLVMALVASGALARWSGPALLPFGEMTYPLYLVHATVGYALFNLFTPGVNRWVLLVGVVVGMCALSWLISRTVEARLQPLLRTGLTRAWAATRGRTRVVHRRTSTAGPALVRSTRSPVATATHPEPGPKRHDDPHPRHPTRY
ncbi:acyltransferase [Plantactinospora sp. B5E13]|uniref:acyltransferase family protein n=1 Tax=unclassified Plantactinospora TaxID=2631981 RepID=UPI00325DEE13